MKYQLTLILTILCLLGAACSDKMNNQNLPHEEGDNVELVKTTSQELSYFEEDDFPGKIRTVEDFDRLIALFLKAGKRGSGCDIRDFRRISPYDALSIWRDLSEGINARNSAAHIQLAKAIKNAEREPLIFIGRVEKNFSSQVLMVVLGDASFRLDGSGSGDATIVNLTEMHIRGKKPKAPKCSWCTRMYGQVPEHSGCECFRVRVCEINCSGVVGACDQFCEPVGCRPLPKYLSDVELRSIPIGSFINRER